MRDPFLIKMRDKRFSNKKERETEKKKFSIYTSLLSSTPITHFLLHLSLSLSTPITNQTHRALPPLQLLFKLLLLLRPLSWPDLSNAIAVFANVIGALGSPKFATLYCNSPPLFLLFIFFTSRARNFHRTTSKIYSLIFYILKIKNFKIFNIIL